jgi:hypothetical protein
MSNGHTTVIASVSEAIHGQQQRRVDCFVASLLAMTARYSFTISPRVRASFDLEPSAPEKTQGRREDRVSDAPAASYAKVKSIRVSHHRFAGSIRPSLRNGFNGFLRSLPGDRAFLPPSLRGNSPQSLIPASGYQNATTSPSANAAPSSTAPLASTTSRPAFRDDRERPSVGRDRDSIRVILAGAEAEYFSDRGWTRFF